MRPSGNRAWRQRASRNRWGPYSWRVIRRHRWITEPPMCDPVLHPRPFTARSLVGMTMGARKRLRRAISKLLDKAHGNLASLGYQHDADRDDSFLRIGRKLRPCVGCLRCKCRSAFDAWPELGEELAKDHPTCDGSGVLPAKHQLCLGCSWCGTPPKEGATRFTQCDGSGVLPARRLTPQTP